MSESAVKWILSIAMAITVPGYFYAFFIGGLLLLAQILLVFFFAVVGIRSIAGLPLVLLVAAYVAVYGALLFFLATISARWIIRMPRAHRVMPVSTIVVLLLFLSTCLKGSECL